MRKGIVRLLICYMLLGTVLAGCGKTTPGNQSQEETESLVITPDRDDLLLKIDAANTNDNLAKLFDRIAYNVEEYTADGDANTGYRYCDKDQFVTVNGRDILIDKNGTVYGYESLYDSVYKYCFLGDSYKFIKENEGTLVNNIAFTYEEVVSSTVANGTLIVESSTEEANEVDVFAAIYGMNEGEVKAIKLVKEVDESTFVIKKQEISLVTPDKEILVYREVIDENPEVYANEAIDKSMNNSEKKKLEYIVGNGTDKEKTYSFEVPVGVTAKVYPDVNMSDIFYTDKEYTQEYSQEDDSITVLYVKYVD